MKTEVVFGFHAVTTILKTAPERIRELKLDNTRRDKRMQLLVDECEGLGIEAEFVPKASLDTLSDGRHQGVVASLAPGRTYTEQDLYALAKNSDQVPLILALDGVTDPHNLGACLRTADAAGVLAVVMPKDNSASVTEVTRKVASGAAETVPLIYVTNLVRALKKLQAFGLWVTGTAGEASGTLHQADLTGPRVIVMGAEGKGMRRLTRDHCDELIRIPMMGLVSSLNVSVATGVVLFEVQRQRG